MRNKDIPDFARRILREHGINTVPCNPLSLARSEGIKVIKDSDVRTLMPGEHGRLMQQDNVCAIIYSDSETPAQKSFTVAHELGHYFLKHSEELARFERYIELQRRRHSHHVERQADIFAKHLLNSNFDNGEFNL